MTVSNEFFFLLWSNGQIGWCISPGWWSGFPHDTVLAPASYFREIWDNFPICPIKCSVGKIQLQHYCIVTSFMVYIHVCICEEKILYLVLLCAPLHNLQQTLSVQLCLYNRHSVWAKTLSEHELSYPQYEKKFIDPVPDRYPFDSIFTYC